jgi:hypothetical protein
MPRFWSRHILNWLIILAIIAILIGFNALYVAGEFATISARRPRLIQMAEEQGNRAARLLLPYIENVRQCRKNSKSEALLSTVFNALNNQGCSYDLSRPTDTARG